MESKTYSIYRVEDSVDRIDEILNTGLFTDSSVIPSRDKLTFVNGYYVNVIALFIDIVGSSEMTDSSRRPTLAKIYRSFISECTAILDSDVNCKEINIHGDCVWGVFDKRHPFDIDNVFEKAGQLSSLVDILNYKLCKKGYPEISVGIGIDYGRALMVKAGYKGSGLNDVIWMGDVVNGASHLSNTAGRNGYSRVIISDVVYRNLKDDYKKLVAETVVNGNKCYHGYIVNIGMDEWLKKNSK